MTLSFSRAGASVSDTSDPPDCEQLVDCSWSERGEGGHSDQYEPLCQKDPIETALEATEYTVSAIEAEKHPGSFRRNKLEGSVAIEMSAQPLLELTPMTGSTALSSSLLNSALQSGLS